MHISERERGNILRFEYRVNSLAVTHTKLISLKEEVKTKNESAR
jgi:hypothetical protein